MIFMGIAFDDSFIFHSIEGFSSRYTILFLFQTHVVILWNSTGTKTKTEQTTKSMGFALKKQDLFLKVSTSQRLIPEIITMNTVKQRFEKLPSEHLEAEQYW